MRLDEVAAELRRRKGVESIDLGILLGRRFWLHFLGPWLILVVPLLIAVQVAVGLALNLVVAILVGWWLKPLFDRVSLHVISRGFFGATPTTWETVRAVWGQWWSLEAMGDLTWRRMSPMRALSMPVRVLEKSGNGAATRGRMTSLYGSIVPGLGWALVVAMVVFKWLVYLAVLVVIGIFGLTGVEGMMLDPWGALFQQMNAPVTVITVVAITTVATTLVEPFYAAGGFGIYIQRRIEREGWDLELKFRKLVTRVKGTLPVMTIVGLAWMMALVPAAQAYDEFDEPNYEGLSEADQILLEAIREGQNAPFPAPRRELVPVENPEEIREQIVEEDPFVERRETVTRWVPKTPEVAPEDDPFRLDPRLLRAVAEVGRVVVTLLFIIFVLWVVWKLVQFLRRYGFGGPREESLQAQWAAELVDDDGEALELPDENIGGAVRDLWRQGKHRRALAMLLLGSLVAIEERYPTRFQPGWTTGRCAREARAYQPEGPVVGEVARAFDALAWAGRRPSDEEFGRLVARWQAAFERRRGGQP